MNSLAHAPLHHTAQKCVVGLQKSLRVGSDGLVGAQAVGVFLIGGEFLGSFSFRFQDKGHERMAFFHDFPERILYPTPVARPRHEKIIPLPITLRQKRLPQSMNTMLTCKLAIIIGCGVEGDMSIGKVMADFSRNFEDAGGLMSFHGFYQLPEGLFQMPGQDTVGIQGVQRILRYGLGPIVRDRRLVLVQVNIMAGGFPRKSHAALIRFCSLTSKVLNMGPVKSKERLWQSEDSQPIDAPMGPEAPAICRSY